MKNNYEVTTSCIKSNLKWGLGMVAVCFVIETALNHVFKENR
jgi:hypothetical protein